MLERAGLRARLAHFASSDDAPAVLALARALQPRVVVISLLFAHRVQEGLALVRGLRRVLPGAHLSLAGMLATFAWRELLAACPALDSVLRGEGEGAIAALATDPAGPVPGLARRSGEPAPLAPPIDLDGLPAPWRGDGIPALGPYGFATTEASRGCHHACTFCLPRAFHRACGVAYRLRSVASVVSEIEYLYDAGVRLFLFDDEQFLPPGEARQERVAELGRELTARGLRIAFTIKCRPDDVEEGLFARLAELGLVRAYVGVESGCLQTLRLLGKRSTPGRGAAALATLDRLGIVADWRAILFHPWSTLEMARTGLGFLASVADVVPILYDYRELEVYPGTPLARRLAQGRPGDGNPWPLAYTPDDTTAELLRRLGRFVFGAGAAYARLQAAHNRAWFACLLRRRFEADTRYPNEAARLCALAHDANSATLALWEEMALFAGRSEARDPAASNAAAAGWAARLQALCLALEGQIERC